MPKRENGTEPAQREKQRQPFSLKLWLSSMWDEMQASLFFSPMIAVFLAIGLAVGLTRLDEHLAVQGANVPKAFATTVDSARAVLSTVAGATISFAGTAFSVSLLLLQLASSQYSPRIVHTLFRDPYNRRIMAMTVGNFTYCLVVMRSVRVPQQGPDDIEVVPTVSVAVAMLLGIFSILAIVAFINHSAHSIDISQLLDQVTKDTIFVIKRTWDFKTDMDSSKREGVVESDDEASKRDLESEKDTCHHWKEIPHARVVRFVSHGWVQEISAESLLQLVPENGFIKVHVVAGRYALPGSAICSVSGLDDDMTQEELDSFDVSVRNLIAVGPSRTMRDDPVFGLRQIVDVTLRALSPGINDPTTAQDGIFHSAALVIEFLQREPPRSVFRTENNGELILDEQPTHDGIVRLAYNEVRVCAAASPTVCMYLIESLRLIREALKAADLDHRAPEIERQVQMIEAGCQEAGHVRPDNEFIATVRNDRFPNLLPLKVDYKRALLS